MNAATDAAPEAAPAPSWRGIAQVLALAMAPMVALGFTRFAYALLLPAMQSDLGWSLSEAGALNTANGMGYLLGALAAAPLASRWGRRRCFELSMWVSALALLLSGTLHGWHLFMSVRFLGGVSTAIIFVLGTALVTRAMPQRPSSALALYFGGSGMGMVLAGAFLPHWLDASAAGWQAAWVMLGVVSLSAALIGSLAARSLRAPPGRATSSRQSGLRQLWPVLVANSLFGAGYVGYTTFVIALLRQQGHGSLTLSLFFCTLGLASLTAATAWGRGLAGLRNSHGFTLVCACVALGILPVLMSSAWPALALSAVVFGASFMAGPAAVSLVAQRRLPEAQLAGALGALTAAFSLGQAVGPLLAGWVADATGQIAVGLWLGPVLLACAAIVSSFQR